MLQKSEESEWSYKRGKEKLERKGLLSEIRSIFDKLDNPGDKRAIETMEKEKGWKTRHKFLEERQFSYDAYHKDKKVALEFEAGAQWKARWHWMKFQMGKNKGDVDVGIIVIKFNEKGIQCKKVKKELKSSYFNGILNLNVPMYFFEVK